MEEETKKSEKNKKKNLVVLSQIPTQEMRILRDEEGNEIEILNIEEALTKILSILSDLDKRI